jgi:manganese oxidase
VCACEESMAADERKEDRHRRKELGLLREALLVGLLLTAGVIAAEHLVHEYALSGQDTLAGNLRHLLRDALLALPLGLAAAVAGRLVARRMGLGSTGSDAAARGVLTALLFALLLVPSAPIHNLIDAALSGGQAAAVTVQGAQPAQPAALSGHQHGLGTADGQIAWLAALENDSSLRGQALHGVNDALIGLVTGVPLAVGGMLLVCGFRPRRRRRRATTGFRARGAARRLALAGASAVVSLAFFSNGVNSTVGGTPALAAASDPCSSSTTPTKTFNVSAINVQITLNHYGDNDPFGMMYVLDQNITAVRQEEAAKTVTTGLREDPIQPLVMRANLGDCVVVNFTNRLTQGALGSGSVPPVSLHVNGVSYAQVGANSGDQVGNNSDGFANPGQSVTYKMFLDPSLGEGSKIFHSHGDSRQLTAHGLFGVINAEPQGSTFLDPQTSQPLNGQSNWESIIQMPSGSKVPSFREFTLVYHEVGDEDFNVKNAQGQDLPQIDPTTKSYRPGSKALNYRSEPFMNRMQSQQAIQNGFFDESQGYGSYDFGDPATPMPRSYLGEPTKTRLVHAGSEQAHVHHLHGGADRWPANPDADPNLDISGGLEKVPGQENNQGSIDLDSQTIGPMETYTLDHECGAGGCQQVAADFLFHCHIAMHYISGMWSFWRVLDTLQPDLGVIPGRSALPAGVNSTGLIGLKLPAFGNKTIVPQSQLTDPTTQVSLESVVESQLPPPGVKIDPQDATVWDWQKQGTSDQPLYVGEPEDTHVWPNFNSANPVPGQGPTPPLHSGRPEILFDPINGRYAWPLLRPHLGSRPPFSPNGHSGTPWLGPTVTATRPDGLCPAGATIRTYNITAITLPITETVGGDVDPNGQIFVLSSDRPDVLAGRKPAIPLAIRSNVGDCVAITLTSQLVDNAENDDFSKVNMHTHFVQFDPQASDGVITGRSFEQSVRPFPTENRTLSAAALPGDTQVTVTNTNRLRPGISIAIGQGNDDIEIDQITAISGNTLTLASALGQAHPAGEPAGTEFVQYRWYSDVDSGTIFWHDHVNGILSWGHGLFGAHIIEPKGSTYHDPKTGAEVRSGAIVDIWNTSGGSVGVGQSGSFREYMVWLHNNTRTTNSPNGPQFPGCEEASINLRAAPLFERSPSNVVTNDQVGNVENGIQGASGSCPAVQSVNDPYTFSSVTHGDPATPLWRAYVGDPVVIRTIGLVERVGGLRIQGHRFRRERFNGNGELQDAGTTGISERFDYIIDGGAGGPAHKAGDYLYYSTQTLALESGAWGLFRVHDTRQSDLEVLPGVTAPPSGAGFPQLTNTGAAPPMANGGGSPCPSGTPTRSFNVSIFNATLPMDGHQDGNGVVYALGSDEQAIKNGTKKLEPLVIRANQGDCVNVTLENDLKSSGGGGTPARAGFTLGKLPYDPQGSSGVAIGFNPDSSIAPGQSFTYNFWADKELGTNIFLNEANEDSMKHGAFGALIVEPTGSTYTSPVDNSTLKSGTQANIRSASGKFREFVALFQDNDPQIGRSIMNYVADVEQGVSAINYNATPLDPRDGNDLSQVFNSRAFGDPSTPVFRAYAGDPVRFRAAMPFGTNVHNFTIDGHSWPWEPLMSGSQILSNRAFMSGEFVDARLVGGAGGTLQTPGDYFYGDARGPYTRAGLWGILRVFATTQPDLVQL